MDLDAGNVAGKVTLDISGLDRNVDAAVSMVAGGSGAMSNSLQKAAEGAQSLVRETARLATESSSALKPGTATTATYSAGLQAAAVAAQQLTARNAALQTAATNALQRAPAGAAAYANALGQAAQAARGLVTQNGQLASSLSNILTIAAGTALGNVFTAGLGEVAKLGDGIEEAVVNGVKLAGQFESIGLAMKIMIGDEAEAAKLMKDLRNFANTTPFQFPELANAAKLLLSMGIDAKDIVSTLRMIGDVSSGLGQPIGEVAYLFGQVKSRTTASGIELREFANRGIPIWDALGKVMGKTHKQVEELTREGSVSFETIQAAFQQMTGEGGRFNDMTRQQAKTIEGLESTLADAWTNLQEQMGEAIVKGTDGRNLLTQITDEITKLTPTAVDFGVALASAFATALPYIKSALEYIQALGVAFGLVDLTKIYPDGYANDRSKGVNGAPNTPESFNKLQQVQGGITNAASNAFHQAGDLANSPASYLRDIGQGVIDLKGGAALAEKMIADARAAVGRGEKLSDDQFAKMRSRIAENVELIGKLQQAINVGISTGNIDEAETAKLTALQTRLRSTMAASGAALTEFEKVAQQQTDADKKAKDDKAKSDKAAEAAASPGSAAGAGTGSVAGGGGRYDLSKAVTDAEIARLQAEGKAEDADTMQAKERLDREIERITAAHDKGELNDADAFTASKAAQDQNESAQRLIHGRYMAEREQDQQRDDEKLRVAGEKAERQKQETDRKLAESAENIEEYQTEIRAAGLRERGNLFAAEMLMFDAVAKKRIDKITDAEERATAVMAYQAARREKIHEHELQVAQDTGKPRNPNDPSTAPRDKKEAEDRIKAAKAGSGERELARLDLRKILGHAESPADAARRAILEKRFGRQSTGDDGADNSLGAGFAGVTPRAPTPSLAAAAAKAGAGSETARPFANRPFGFQGRSSDAVLAAFADRAAADEAARSDHLNKVFGRDLSLPSPIDAVAGRVAPSTATATPSGGADQSNRPINASVPAVNEKQLGAAIAAVIEPKIRYYLSQYVAAARAAGYASDVQAGL